MTGLFAILRKLRPVCDVCGAVSDDPDAWWHRAAAGHIYGPVIEEEAGLGSDPICVLHGDDRVTRSLCTRCAVTESREHVPLCGCPRQALAEWECAAFLGAIDRGEVELWADRIPCDEFCTVTWTAAGGPFAGWRVAVFKDGYGVSWDYVERVDAADGRDFDAWRRDDSDRQDLACDDCAGMVRNWSPSPTVLRERYGMSEC